MNTEKSAQQIMEEWNARAKAVGCLLEQDPWTLPRLYDGSLLDIPETPESQMRIEWLKQQIAELQREKLEQNAVFVSSAPVVIEQVPLSATNDIR